MQTLTGKPLLGAIKQHTAANRDARALFERVRAEVMPIKPSQYDVASTCNLKCEGCLYFDGSFFTGQTRLSHAAFVDFFAAEADRGINYPHFGGAEPALVQDLLAVAAEHFSRGVVYTNGTIRIDPAIRFRLHISIWGSVADSVKLRGADVMGKALRNYAGDDRAVFVVTINSRSLHSLDELAQTCADHGVRMSFNHYSPTANYLDHLASAASNDDAYFRFSRPDENLLLSASDFPVIERKLDELLDRHPDTIIYDRAFSRWINDPRGIYAVDDVNGWATNCASRLGSLMRHFQPDLQEVATTKCCTPNIECKTCRLYAMAYASAIDRLGEFAMTEHGFVDWLAIVDTWCRLFLLDWERDAA